MPLNPAPFDLPDLAASLSALKGVGPATAQALAARGYRTWGDALFIFPNRYEDRRLITPMAEVEAGRVAVVKGRVAGSGRLGKAGKVWRMELEDDSGRLGLMWFQHRRLNLAQYAVGDELVAVGEPTQDRGGGLMMAHPELYPAGEVGPGHPGVGRVVPVYPGMEGVRPGLLRKALAELVESTAGLVQDPLYKALPRELYPLPAGAALRWAHQPPPESGPEDLDPAQAPWRKSLAVNELFHFELALALKRRRRDDSPAPPLAGDGVLLRRFIAGLPFTLTPGQEEAVAQITRDLAQSRPMGRLLMGDVGTGKTVVAAAAAVVAAAAGHQAALMAPTEVLARQHYASLGKLLEPLGLSVALVTGGQNGAERKEALAAMAGGADLVVGTHALISQGAEFKRLGLAMVDEQHRFGVHQRLKLAAKGATPHLLVLSATPIPRTLALALAGHLEISDLPQRPGGRPPVATKLVPHAQRRSALIAMEQALARGEQVYVICPLVEASSAVEAQDVEATQRRLAAWFKGQRVGLLHGRMDADRQEAELAAFRSGESRVLCATTVVEVGVDVPTATLMVVLAAERFGLSQLHQLRGRVGRGEKPGSCLLVPGPEPGELGLERLKVLCATSDGAQVAEADLMLRGPGEAMGGRQSGLPPFRAARWSLDAELVPALREVIAQWLKLDSELKDPLHAKVAAEARRRWGRRLGLEQAG